MVASASQMRFTWFRLCNVNGFIYPPRTVTALGRVIFRSHPKFGRSVTAKGGLLPQGFFLLYSGVRQKPRTFCLVL